MAGGKISFGEFANVAVGVSDGAILKPRPSKADQFGAFWCDKPTFLPYRKHNKVYMCCTRVLVGGTGVNVSSTWSQATMPYSAFVCSR